MSGVYVQGKCVIAIESRFGSKGNPSSQDVAAREIHRVRMWQQGKSIESGFGSKGYPSSQSLAAGIAVESRFGSKESSIESSVCSRDSQIDSGIFWICHAGVRE